MSYVRLNLITVFSADGHCFELRSMRESYRSDITKTLKDEHY